MLGAGVRAASGCVWVAQDAEDRSQLADRLVACLLDRLERRAGLAWSGSFRGGSGLDVDLGQGVGDDVMQVTGDPQPFLFGAARGFLLARALGQLEPLLEQPQVRAVGADLLGGQQRKRNQQHVPECL